MTQPTSPATATTPSTRPATRTRTMRAIVKPRSGPGVEIRDVPVPKCAPTELLLRVLRAGVCGTDLHIYSWDRWSESRIRPPVVLGHEFVGEIVEVGSEVSGFSVGQRVSCESHIVCGNCISCRTGNAHVCENTIILGVDRDGGFAEFVAVPAANAWPAPANVSLEVAGIMEPLGNAVHTAFAGPLAACNIGITGCGPIGLFAIAVARAAGAARVIASDVASYRMGVAQRLNADVVIDAARESFPERITEITGGRGLDGVLEMSGHPQAMRDGLLALRNAGRLSLLGLPKEPFELDWNRWVIFKGVTVQGIVGRRLFETWHQMDNLLTSGRLDVTPAITHVMPMEQFEDAIQLLRSGQAGKVVLVPWGESA